MLLREDKEEFEKYPWCGCINEFPYFDDYPWLKRYSNKNYFIVSSAGWDVINELPKNYDAYIFIHHIELCDVHWLKAQQKRINAPFYVLLSGNSYNVNINNVTFIPYTHWHKDLQQIINWWGIQQAPNIKKYKFSAVCNRVTQSKIWVTTKLFEVAYNTSLIIHSSKFIEDKNIHNWEHSGNIILDDLTDLYLEKYIDLEVKDGFDKNKNFQKYNSNPWQPIYTDAAMHFTNGSHHYSFMMDDYIPYIYPGPHIDEKTFKCLIAGTPFIPTAQFDIYRSLSQFGLNFDYEFNTNWDNDPGNLSRFESIIKLIDSLNEYSTDELYNKTKEISTYNQQYIFDGTFYKNCELHNEESIETLHSLLA